MWTVVPALVSMEVVLVLAVTGVILYLVWRRIAHTSITVIARNSLGSTVSDAINGMTSESARHNLDYFLF